MNGCQKDLCCEWKSRDGRMRIFCCVSGAGIGWGWGPEFDSSRSEYKPDTQRAPPRASSPLSLHPPSSVQAFKTKDELLERFIKTGTFDADAKKKATEKVLPAVTIADCWQGLTLFSVTIAGFTYYGARAMLF